MDFVSPTYITLISITHKKFQRGEGGSIPGWQREKTYLAWFRRTRSARVNEMLNFFVDILLVRGGIPSSGFRSLCQYCRCDNKKQHPNTDLFGQSDRAFKIEE